MQETLDKAQHCFMIKKKEIRKLYFSILRLYTIDIANSIYTTGETECISLESRNKTRYHLSPLFLNIVLESSNKEREIKGYKLGRKRSKYLYLQTI